MEALISPSPDKVAIRGILSDEYGVRVDDVTHYTGGEEQPNRPEKLPLNLPSYINVKRIGPQQTLSALIREGEIDALAERGEITYNDSEVIGYQVTVEAFRDATLGAYAVKLIDDGVFSGA